jgi:hypothetical protein
MPRFFTSPELGVTPEVLDPQVVYRCEIELDAATVANATEYVKGWGDPTEILGAHAAYVRLGRAWWLDYQPRPTLLLEFRVRTTAEAFRAFSHGVENWENELLSALWEMLKRVCGTKKAAFFEWDALDQFPGRRRSFTAVEQPEQPPAQVQPLLHLRTGNTAP